MTTRALLALLGTALLGGCAINPVTRRPEFVVMSAAKERELGAEEAKQVEQAIGFAGSPQLAGHVSEVGARVATASPRTDVQYTFHIIEMSEPNAFALPNGDVYVSRGLLVLLNSDDELAGVLGHEVGHIAARHSVQRASRAAPLAVVTGVVSGVAGIANPTLGQLVGGVGNVTTGLLVASYSRDQERQADELGQQFESAAGWDPSGLSRALAALQRAEAMQPNGPRRTSFFDSHPSTPERVERTASYARTLATVPAPDAAARAAFVQRLDGLVVGSPASEGTVDGPLFLHPDLDLAVRFPDEWRIVNARTQVGAAPVRGGALIVLDTATSGDDPMLGVRAMERETGAKLESRVTPLTINGLAAAQTRVTADTESGPLALYLTWIAYQGRVYRFIGLIPPDGSAAFAPVFEKTVRSFRPLTAAERGRIRETRLRLVTAKAGETPTALAARAGSAWSADMVATANGVAVDAPLAAGDTMKVAISEPYRP